MTSLSELPSVLAAWLQWVVLTHGTTLLIAAPTTMALLTGLQHGLRAVRHHCWARNARLVEIKPPPDSELSHAETLWTHLLGLLRPAWKRLVFGQPHVVWEYELDAHGVRVRLWVPGPVPPGQVERAVTAAWPGATTTTVPVPPRDPTARGEGAVLRLARPDHYPLATDYEEDPSRAVLGAAGGCSDTERVLIQVYGRPVTGHRLRRATQAAGQLRHSDSTTGRVFDALTPTTSTTRTSTSLAALRPEISGEIRAILKKSSSPRLETYVRYLVTTPATSSQGREQRRGRAHAVAGAFAVFTGLNHYIRHRRPLIAHRLAEARYLGYGDLLSARELAAVAHLPTDEVVPGMQRAPARPIPPPPGIATDAPDTRLLGDAEGTHKRPVALRAADARQHLHVPGATGTGKTTFLFNMILDDITKNRSVVLIEPKGESNLLLSRIPEQAIDRVVLIDPDDNAPPPTLSVLSSGARELAANMVTSIFKRIFADSWGPRTEDILRSACLTLAGSTRASLANIPRVLESATMRREITTRITDPVLSGFWEWYEGLSPAARSQAIAPLMNKIRSVLIWDFARDVLAANPEGHTPTNGLNLSRLLDHGAIIIARLPKGTLGEETSRLVGSLLLAQVWRAVLSRSRQPEAERHDLGIYLDECQNFLTLPQGVEDMLAEARAYKAGLTLAHQDMAQLPADLREAVSTNARNKVYFTVSPDDARPLARHVRPELGEHDLAHLDTYQAAARLVSHGGIGPACTLRTRPLPPPIKGRATAVRRAARQHSPTHTGTKNGG